MLILFGHCLFLCLSLAFVPMVLKPYFYLQKMFKFKLIKCCTIFSFWFQIFSIRYILYPYTTIIPFFLRILGITSDTIGVGRISMCGMHYQPACLQFDAPKAGCNAFFEKICKSVSLAEIIHIL